MQLDSPALEDKQQQQQQQEQQPQEHFRSVSAAVSAAGGGSSGGGKALETLFYVPSVPQLTKVPPPPTGARRPPQPGYDMRTLRRQLDFLNQELQGGEERQHLLYLQNEQLWHYIQELLQANKSNAQLMRSEVGRLQSELRSVYKERQQLAEQLLLARNSKDMMRQLSSELQERAPALQELRQRKLEAEQQLLAAQAENEGLEVTLREQLQQMRGVHDELEALRRQKEEDAALEVADEFFSSSRTVLRSAYQRFKRGVQQRYRMECISGSIRRVYCSYLQRQVWELWRYYCSKRRFMRSCQQRRRTERLQLCVRRWKLHTALERLFGRARRRLLLRRNLRAWRAAAAEQRYDAWALQATQHLQDLQLQRRVFRRWAGGTVFTGWYDPRMQQLMVVAAQYHRQRLLLHWKRVAAEGRRQLHDAAAQLPLVKQLSHFRCWHRLCGLLWRRRGRLLRRFFRQLRLRVRMREERAVTRRFVLTAAVRWKLRSAARRWQRFTAIRRGYYRRGFGGRSASAVRRSKLQLELQYAALGSPQQLLQKQRWQRLARSCFLQWEYSASVRRRQRVLAQAALQHHQFELLLRRPLLLWRRHVRVDVRTRRRKERRLQRQIFSAWASQAQQLKQQRIATLQRERFRELQHHRRLLLLLRKWHRRARKVNRLRRVFDSRVRSAAYARLRRLFSSWRALWGHQQHWRCKELQLETQRMHTIVALNEQSLEDLDVERTQLEHQRREMEESVLQMQQRLTECSSLMQNQERLLLQKEREKQEYIEQLQRMQKEHQQLTEDRNRLREFEQQLQYERSEREQETLRLEAAAQEVFSSLLLYLTTMRSIDRLMFTSSSSSLVGWLAVNVL